MKTVGGRRRRRGGCKALFCSDRSLQDEGWWLFWNCISAHIRWHLSIHSLCDRDSECSPGWPGTLFFLLQPSEWALYLHTNIKQFYNEFQKEVMLILYSYMQLLTIDWMLLICKSKNWKTTVWTFFITCMCECVCTHMLLLCNVCTWKSATCGAGSLFHHVGSWDWWGQSGGECLYLLSHLVHPKVWNFVSGSITT